MTPKKILLVEDDPFLLSIITHAFEGAGYTVLKAVNGEMGVELFFSEKPDAVVLDIIMPKMDGHEMMEAVFAKDPETTVPFFVLSNADEMEHVSKAIGERAVAYLIKSERGMERIVDTVRERIGEA